mgnify:CR=1 FL=1
MHQRITKDTRILRHERAVELDKPQAENKDKKNKKNGKHTKGARPVEPQAQLSDLFGSSSSQSEDDDADMGAAKVNTKNLFESDSEGINLFGDA